MLNQFAKFLQTGYTPFHVVKNVCEMLDKAGFNALKEGQRWQLTPNTGYYVTRNGSSIIAFKTGDLDVKKGFNIVASHTDSPCLRLKNNCMTYCDTYAKLNVETYGGALYYSMLDRPLRIAGRLVVSDGDNLAVENVASDFCVVIPSLAIHQNREANDGLRLNPQSAELHRELAWLFLSKIGGNVDEASPIYAERWASVVDAAKGDWSRLRMNPSLVSYIDSRYGRQDWRNPKASALYWAHHGLALKPTGAVRAELRQVLYQTLMLLSVEDARFAPKALQAMREAYVEQPSPSLKDTILRFRAKFSL